MEDIVRIENRWYILAGSSLVDHRTLVLKDGETFGAFNAYGDVESIASGGQGIFAEGMRHLSRLETRLNGRRPLLLSSAVATDNGEMTVDLTNPDIKAADGQTALPHGAIHVQRSRTIRGGACFDRLTVATFDERASEAVIGLTFDADFCDIFEIRGTTRKVRGKRLEPEAGGRTVRLGYEGLDGITRLTVVEFEPAPEVLTVSHARFTLRLKRGEKHEIAVTVRCEPVAGKGSPLSFREAARGANEEIDEAAEASCGVVTTNQQLNRWLNRSRADVRMLTTMMETGPYPFAGIPWYSCPFGRDGIITALQCLWINPGLARGVLGFLARTQATEVDPAHDAEPGKIFHEWRSDEMANVGEVPFGHYYGTVDATPLFVVLAGSYFHATADVDLVRSLWPCIERALEWIDTYGDEDRDGFVEYRQRSAGGLSNQGWKDAADSVFHADGALAKAPIALCEVQGYVFAAKRHAAAMARVVGQYERAEALEHQATVLKKRFHEFFWNDQIGTYALALDGEKAQCAVRTSNPGHCLWTGVADPAVASRVAETLIGKRMFSGWGIRTVAAGESRYNPMAYHNGSVWPHDNAIASAGMARYGLRQPPQQLLSSWMEASGFLDLHRLPELICGFRRRSGNAPTQYPVACSPQAWAAGAAFMFLGACLGLEVDATRRAVRLTKPVLPGSVREVQLTGLRVGRARVDLLFHRERDDVGVLVQNREGEVAVLVEK